MKSSTKAVLSDLRSQMSQLDTSNLNDEAKLEYIIGASCLTQALLECLCTEQIGVSARLKTSARELSKATEDLEKRCDDLEKRLNEKERE